MGAAVDARCHCQAGLSPFLGVAGPARATGRFHPKPPQPGNRSVRNCSLELQSTRGKGAPDHRVHGSFGHKFPRVSGRRIAACSVPPRSGLADFQVLPTPPSPLPVEPIFLQTPAPGRPRHPATGGQLALPARVPRPCDRPDCPAQGCCGVGPGVARTGQDSASTRCHQERDRARGCAWS
jgi:hypothetical protein